MTRVAPTRAFVLLALALPVTARADGWYYTWSCLGECAPFVEGSDTSGPFATQAECEHVRSMDQRPWALEHLNNTGGLSLCEWVGAAGNAPVGATPPAEPVALAGFELAVHLGPGWRTRQGDTTASTGFGAGLDIQVYLGEPAVGGFLLIGFHGSSLALPAAGRRPFYFTMPVLIGARITPTIALRSGWGLRPLLAAGYGGFLQQCGACPDGTADALGGWGYVLQGGLQVVPDVAEGMGVGVSAMSFGLKAKGAGAEIRSPPWAIRVSVGGVFP